MSRIQSRDLEWYFFSSLDRKYSNRSRTNRATGGGYWKTTGKDRPVLHGSRTVGMKKTLVYHTGRAPRGQRTHWVMHEYRLVDEGLRDSGVSQDGYVVCRIFQKSGNGPMNGAQYGAPLIEEEWEEDDDMEIKPLDGDAGGLVDVGIQMDDIVKDPEVSFPPENMHHLLVEHHEEQVNGSHLEISTSLRENIVGDQFYMGGVDGCPIAAVAEDDPTLTAGVEGHHLILDQSCILLPENDGYVELNDFMENEDQDQPKNDSLADYVLETCDEDFLINMNGCGDLPEIDVDEFFDMLSETSDIPEPSQMPPLENDVSPQPSNINSSFSKQSDAQFSESNLVSNDALEDIPFAQDSFVPKYDSGPSITDVFKFDKADEMVNYFDATDNYLDFASLGPVGEFELEDFSNFEISDFSDEFDGTIIPTQNAAQKSSYTDAGIVASSSTMLSAPNDMANGKKDDLTVKKDVQKNDQLDKTFTERLANMLNFIPSPPALAAEHPYGAIKSIDQNSTALAASSNFTAGMIHISSFTVTSTANQCYLQKGRAIGFLFSYNTLGKSASLEPAMMMHDGFTRMVLRGGLYLFLFSTLILAGSFKIGLHMCSR
ncbi:uncharacterized protein LOC120260780 [Dioscorea cayenensis subsp. rotundata]|uniref:Uncharacterized protein LOC120260780 n=1 Tax=Dioscorea cayennensis subsp. rotundata TaxID=55577 RepID=A0AB40BAF2_DIOCR|nr:uncharacterized protein LOC120260780 [Dioscorea cayenensis subsp. rotundata]